MLATLNAAIDTAIIAIPIAFIALVITREILKATATHPTPPIALAPIATPTPIAAPPIPQQPTQIDLIIATVRSAELRRYCSEAGIRWRNAHGKGRHLSSEEMRQALLAVGNLDRPWVA